MDFETLVKKIMIENTRKCQNKSKCSRMKNDTNRQQQNTAYLKYIKLIERYQSK